MNATTTSWSSPMPSGTSIPMHHSHSVDNIFPKLAELATTEEVLARL